MLAPDLRQVSPEHQPLLLLIAIVLVRLTSVTGISNRLQVRDDIRR